MPQMIYSAVYLQNFFWYIKRAHINHAHLQPIKRAHLYIGGALPVGDGDYELSVLASIVIVAVFVGAPASRSWRGNAARCFPRLQHSNYLTPK